MSGRGSPQSAHVPCQPPAKYGGGAGPFGCGGPVTRPFTERKRAAPRRRARSCDERDQASMTPSGTSRDEPSIPRPKQSKDRAHGGGGVELLLHPNVL